MTEEQIAQLDKIDSECAHGESMKAKNNDFAFGIYRGMCFGCLPAKLGIIYPASFMKECLEESERSKNNPDSFYNKILKPIIDTPDPFCGAYLPIPFEYKNGK